MSESTKVFWHGAFFEALQLEFHHYRDSLKFENEFHLSKEALKMDVLVIKKRPGERIDKNIGKIFRTHNVFEFKSEIDSLSERDYNKVCAYALLDRLMQANRDAFKEAMNMMSDVAKELFFEVAEKGGWLLEDRLENTKTIAKKLLLRGRPIEEVVEDTGLSHETVIALKQP